jgi:UDP-galactopyranose mutase
MDTNDKTSTAQAAVILSAPVLTLIIPTYNMARLLPYCISTILEQRNAARLEVLIINDGSTDETKDVASRLIERYNTPEAPIIRLINKENGGHGSTINVGIAEAHGTYLRIIDADDWVDSENLADLIDTLAGETASIVLTDYSEDNQRASGLVLKRLYTFMIPGKQYLFDDLCSSEHGFKDWGPILATGNFNTRMLQHTGFRLTEKSAYVDMEFDMYSIIDAETVSYYPLDIYRYYIGRSGQSISQASYLKNRAQHENVIFGMLAYLSEHTGISQKKQSYIVDKLVIPMVVAQYMILVEWLSDRGEFLDFEKRLKPWTDVHQNQRVSTRSIRFHRKTGGLFLKSNQNLRDLSEALRRVRRRPGLARRMPRTKTLDILSMKWKKPEPGIVLRQTEGGLTITNESESPFYVTTKKSILVDGKYCHVRYKGQSLKGNSATFYLTDSSFGALGESGLGSDGIYDFQGFEEEILPLINILPHTEVLIEQLAIEFFDEQAEKDDFLLDACVNDVLVIMPEYPSLESRYHGGFIHARVKAYQQAGLNFDVVCCWHRKSYTLSSFEGIDVLRVSFSGLRSLLQNRHYRKILVHFVDEEYMRVFDSLALRSTELFFWIHGPETLYWDWPLFTCKYFQKPAPLDESQVAQFERNDVLFKHYNEKENVTFVFVSDWIKKRSEELIGISFKQAQVIPNIVDEATFVFEEKDPDLRKKVFFIRRFDNVDKYAIDINVKCILELSERPCFGDLEFNIYGSGEFYEELIAPIRDFSNVHLHPWFLTHDEIAAVHRSNGIALFATRYDAQGVSMCEAALSGLAVVSSENEAIKQFLPTDQRLLAETEDPVAYADIIEGLYNDPERFSACSRACHEKAYETCGRDKTIQKEIELVRAAESKAITEDHLETYKSENPVLTMLVLDTGKQALLSTTLNSIASANRADVLEVLVIDACISDFDAALKLGIEQARGAYLKILCAGDWLCTETLQALLETLKAEGASVVLTDYSDDLVTAMKLARKKPRFLLESAKRASSFGHDDDKRLFAEWEPQLPALWFKTVWLKSVESTFSADELLCDIELTVQVSLSADTSSYHPLDVVRHYREQKESLLSLSPTLDEFERYQRILFKLLNILTIYPEAPEATVSYVEAKLIVPMIWSSYELIFNEFPNRKVLGGFEGRLKEWSQLYHDRRVMTRVLAMHRRTGGILLRQTKLLRAVSNRLNTTRQEKSTSMEQYDVLVVGSGLFGSLIAHEAHRQGKRVLVVERRGHIGGNCYTKSVAGIPVHLYGAHIFRTNERKVLDYLLQFCELNNFINAPIANYKGELYNMPFNMNTFRALWNTTTPAEAKAKIAEQRVACPNPGNLEEHILNLVGRDIYEKLVKGYTEKQWGKPCAELPASLMRRIPLRFTYDNNYFNDRYQGVPVGGYTPIFEKLLKGVEVRLGVDYLQQREELEQQAGLVVFTGPVDEYYNYRLGQLEYRSLRFEHETLDMENYQGVAVMNFTDFETPYTRIIEHKHFDAVDVDKTVISREYPLAWTPEVEPYYPMEDAGNIERYAAYAERAAQEAKVVFGGRLGEYKYYDMQDTIASALEKARVWFSEEGEGTK